MEDQDQKVLTRADLAERFGCSVPDVTKALIDLKIDRDKYDSIPLEKVNAIEHRLKPSNGNSELVPIPETTADDWLLPNNESYHVRRGAELAEYHFSLQRAAYRLRMEQLIKSERSPSSSALGKAEEVAVRILGKA